MTYPRSPKEWKAYYEGYNVHYWSYIHFRKVLSSILLPVTEQIKSTVEALVEAPARVPQRFTTQYPYGDLKNHNKLCENCHLHLPLTASKCPYCGASENLANLPETRVDQTNETIIIKPRNRQAPDHLDQRVYDYIVAHDGTITYSQTFRDIAITTPKLRASIKRLKSLGLLRQKHLPVSLARREKVSEAARHSQVLAPSLNEAALGSDESPSPQPSIEEGDSGNLICPRCESENTCRVGYGYPQPLIDSYAIMRDMKQGIIWSGRCERWPWSPRGYCKECREYFGAKRGAYESYLEEWKAYKKAYRAKMREEKSYWSIIHESFTSTMISFRAKIKSTFESLVEFTRAPIHLRFTTHYTYPGLMDHNKNCAKCYASLPLTVSKCPYCSIPRNSPDLIGGDVLLTGILDMQVYDYIVEHNGTISRSRAAMMLGIIHTGELRRSVNRLKSMGLLTEKRWVIPFSLHPKLEPFVP